MSKEHSQILKPEALPEKREKPQDLKYPLYLYHPELAREGKKCLNPDHHKGKGWVDTPAKFPKGSALA
jgi:hypothetical protein